jgi:hypothetical protein
LKVFESGARDRSHETISEPLAGGKAGTVAMYSTDSLREKNHYFSKGKGMSKHVGCIE